MTIVRGAESRWKRFFFLSYSSEKWVEGYFSYLFIVFVVNKKFIIYMCGPAYVKGVQSALVGS